MKHVFILNPKAGNGAHLDETRAAIRRLDGDVTVYETKAPKDATRYIRAFCESHTEEDVRFYACGGDGTIKEVAEGILGFPHASMSCFPIGSGNDFVKYYGGRERFADLAALVAADALPVDMITLGDEYSVNVCNFGFDAAVAETMNRVRRVPLLGGKHAYTTGIVRALVTARRNHCDIYADGEKLTGKAFLLCTIANGAYVGGAFRCAPRAKNDAGGLRDEADVALHLSLPDGPLSAGRTPGRPPLCQIHDLPARGARGGRVEKALPGLAGRRDHRDRTLHLHGAARRAALCRAGIVRAEAA